MKERIYLAGPYGSPDEKLQNERLVDHAVAAGLLMKAGYLVFSPITHSGLIVALMDGHLHDTREFWLRQCDSYIHNWTTKLVVLPLKGWKQSVGTRHEMNLAEMLGIPVIISWNLKKLVEMYKSASLLERENMLMDEGTLSILN